MKFHAQLSWAWKKFYNLGSSSIGRHYGPHFGSIVPPYTTLGARLILYQK